jgi:hypothetical protein
MKEDFFNSRLLITVSIFIAYHVNRYIKSVTIC